MTSKHLLFYKDGLTGRVEITVIESNGTLSELREKTAKLLEDKAVEWAFTAAGDWMIKPEN